MAHTRTAKKRLRQNVKKRTANRAQVSRLKTELKKTKARIQEGKPEEAKAQLSIASQALDKAAKKNLIHPNKASRVKSRLAKKIAAASKK